MKSARKNHPGREFLSAGMKQARKNHPRERIFIRRDEISEEESSLREDFYPQRWNKRERIIPERGFLSAGMKSTGENFVTAAMCWRFCGKSKLHLYIVRWKPVVPQISADSLQNAAAGPGHQCKPGACRGSVRIFSTRSPSQWQKRSDIQPVRP